MTGLSNGRQPPSAGLPPACVDRCIILIVMQPPHSSVADDFISFCQQRCGKEWPDFYDEMCWVAGRRLFRDMGYAELSQVGLSLSLCDIEETASLVAAVTSANNRRETKATG